MNHTQNSDSVQPSAPLTHAVQGSAVLFRPHKPYDADSIMLHISQRQRQGQGWSDPPRVHGGRRAG